LAIDGRSAAGKTTLAEELAIEFKGEVIHMDDFFLPVELRKQERFEEAGGNVHYERFMEEVIPNLQAGKEFEYRLFSCSKMDYDGRKKIRNEGLIIVEGAYSMHPLFVKYWDLGLFYDINIEEQYERILKRDGLEKAKIFKSRWIPFEEKYILETDVIKKADYILK